MKKKTLTLILNLVIPQKPTNFNLICELLYKIKLIDF